MQNISDIFSDMALHNGRYKKHAQYRAPSPTCPLLFFLSKNKWYYHYLELVVLVKLSVSRSHLRHKKTRFDILALATSNRPIAKLLPNNVVYCQ